MKSGTVLLVVVLGAASWNLGSSPARADANGGSPHHAARPGARKPKDLKTAEDCGECHKDIYRMWHSSAHATSMEDPIFQNAWRETTSGQGEQVSRLCLGCHAPLAAATQDLALKQRLTWEGVSCDVCHSIVSVEEGRSGVHQTFDLGPVKRGPIPNADSPAHETAYSELHTSALVCAGCHEFVNSEGTAVLTTYSEWKTSGAAKSGKTCQTCHMSKTAANVVDPQVARLADVAVNLHDVPGGHSLDQLHKALHVSIEPQRSADSVRVRVRIENRGAGHAVPTGMPGRHVILEVSVHGSNGVDFQEKRFYGKQFTDAGGAVITRDSGYFAKGLRLKEDSRFKPDEQRIESFTFPLPAASAAYVTVKLHYEHAPTGGAENRTWLTFFSESRTIAP